MQFASGKKKVKTWLLFDLFKGKRSWTRMGLRTTITFAVCGAADQELGVANGKTCASLYPFTPLYCKK